MNPSCRKWQWEGDTQSLQKDRLRSASFLPIVWHHAQNLRLLTSPSAQVVLPSPLLSHLSPNLPGSHRVIFYKLAEKSFENCETSTDKFLILPRQPNFIIFLRISLLTRNECKWQRLIYNFEVHFFSRHTHGRRFPPRVLIAIFSTLPSCKQKSPEFHLNIQEPFSPTNTNLKKREREWDLWPGKGSLKCLKRYTNRRMPEKDIIKNEASKAILNNLVKASFSSNNKKKSDYNFETNFQRFIHLCTYISWNTYFSFFSIWPTTPSRSWGQGWNHRLLQKNLGELHQKLTQKWPSIVLLKLIYIWYTSLLVSPLTLMAARLIKSISSTSAAFPPSIDQSINQKMNLLNHNWWNRRRNYRPTIIKQNITVYYFPTYS